MVVASGAIYVAAVVVVVGVAIAVATASFAVAGSDPAAVTATGASERYESNERHQCAYTTG